MEPLSLWHAACPGDSAACPGHSAAPARAVRVPWRLPMDRSICRFFFYVKKYCYMFSLYFQKSNKKYHPKSPFKNASEMKNLDPRFKACYYYIRLRCISFETSEMLISEKVIIRQAINGGVSCYKITVSEKLYTVKPRN